MSAVVYRAFCCCKICADTAQLDGELELVWATCIAIGQHLWFRDLLFEVSAAASRMAIPLASRVAGPVTEDARSMSTGVCTGLSEAAGSASSSMRASDLCLAECLATDPKTARDRLARSVSGWMPPLSPQTRPQLVFAAALAFTLPRWRRVNYDARLHTCSSGDHLAPWALVAMFGMTTEHGLGLQELFLRTATSGALATAISSGRPGDVNMTAIMPVLATFCRISNLSQPMIEQYFPLGACQQI